MIKKVQSKLAWLVVFVLSPVLTFAQSGVNGLNAATTNLKTYVDPVTDISLVIGGIVGIVGGIRVYSKWNSGDQDINKELMGWGGSCLFLVLSSLIIKAFFGL
jgi:Na+/H+ antiporter NhaA